jgi:hypothetical protein
MGLPSQVRTLPRNRPFRSVLQDGFLGTKLKGTVRDIQWKTKGRNILDKVDAMDKLKPWARSTPGQAERGGNRPPEDPGIGRGGHGADKLGIL